MSPLLLVGLYNVSFAIGGFVLCLACYWWVHIMSLLLFVGSYHVTFSVGGFISVAMELLIPLE